MLYGMALLAKICNDKTRGSMFGLVAFLGSVGIVFLQAIGGNIFEKFNLGPFVFAYSLYVIGLVIIQCLAFGGKLV